MKLLASLCHTRWRCLERGVHLGLAKTRAIQYKADIPDPGRKSTTVVSVSICNRDFDSTQSNKAGLLICFENFRCVVRSEAAGVSTFRNDSASLIELKRYR